VADTPRAGEFNGGEGSRALTAASIAASVGGTLVGDETAIVSAIAPLGRAQSHHLTFLANAKYASLLATANAGVLLVAPDLAETPGSAKARIVVAKPHEAMLSISAALYPPSRHAPGVHATAVLGNGVTLGEDVAIGPYVVIGDGARIGARVNLHAHVTVGAGVEVGDDVELFEGVTLYRGARGAPHGGGPTPVCGSAPMDSVTCFATGRTRRFLMWAVASWRRMSRSARTRRSIVAASTIL
jgi:hypothetical protein